MDLGLAGKVALVTAASKGLGRASAEAFADEGVSVAISARGETALLAAEASCRERGAQTLALVGDLNDPDEPARLVAATLERFGRLDIVVANNGGPPPGGALEVDDEALLAAIEANFLASVRLVRAALPTMRAAGWGRVCCIASYTVVQPLLGLASSNAARTALRAWAKTAAQDLAPSGVTINLACPGTHATDRMIELGAIGGAAGDAGDFGRIVAFLCSASASFINGATVVVDGGQTLAL